MNWAITVLQNELLDLQAHQYDQEVMKDDQRRVTIISRIYQITKAIEVLNEMQSV